jgi:hypothetical protein
MAQEGLQAGAAGIAPQIRGEQRAQGGEAFRAAAAVGLRHGLQIDLFGGNGGNPL